MATQSRQPKLLDPAPSLERDGEPELYGTAYRQIEMLNGQELHALHAKGQGMLIGVLDSGFICGALIRPWPFKPYATEMELC